MRDQGLVGVVDRSECLLGDGKVADGIVDVGIGSGRDRAAAKHAVGRVDHEVGRILRHLAHVERIWFKIRFDGQDLPRLYQTAEDPDGDFDGAVADQAVVDEAWESWRAEVAFAEKWTEEHSLDVVATLGDHGQISLRELLVHMIEEYARHNGHADLLRECVDGRIGQ